MKVLWFAAHRALEPPMEIAPRMCGVERMAGGVGPILGFPSMDNLAISTMYPDHEAGPMALERITFCMGETAIEVRALRGDSSTLGPRSRETL